MNCQLKLNFLCVWHISLIFEIGSKDCLDFIFHLSKADFQDFQLEERWGSDLISISIEWNL